MRRRGQRTDADFTRFVAERGNSLARTAYLIAGDHDLAEDMLQAALADAYVRWGLFSGAGDAERFVRRALVESNTARNRRRSSGEVLVAELPDGVVGDHSSAAGVREDVMAALRQLSPQQRSVIVLRYFDDLTEADVAQVLSCSVGAVKQHAWRGMQKLRELLAEVPVGAP